MPNMIVTISGLALFVRETKKKRVTILMPTTGSGGYGNVMTHWARAVVYKNNGDELWRESIEGWSLVIPPSLNPAPLNGVPATLANLTLPLAAHKSVRQECLDDSDAGKLAISRVQFSDGSGTDKTDGPFHFADAKKAQLCHKVVWKIDNVSRNKVKLESLTSSVTKDLAIPANKTGDYAFTILHLPSDDFQGRPGKPHKGEPALHFVALYSFFDDPEYQPIPIYGGETKSGAEPRVGRTLPGTKRRATPVEIHGGNPVTCVGAQATDSQPSLSPSDVETVEGGWPG